MPTIPDTATILTNTASGSQAVYNALTPVQNLYLAVGFGVLFFLIVVGVIGYLIGHAKPN